MKKKILIVSSFRFFETYEKPISYGFKKNNYKVFFFKIFPTYKKNLIDKIIFFFVEKIKLNIFLKKINNNLIKKVKKYKPNILFFWRSTTILPITLKKIKLNNPNIKIIIYHNDNPYSGIYNYFKYRHYLNSIKYADVAAVYRPNDFKTIKKFKPKKIKLLKPNYISYLHKPLKIKKNKDVIFIGHFTSERGHKLNLLYKNDIKFNVYGNGWNKFGLKMNWHYNTYGPGKYKNEYVKLINQSKIAICFLSAKNNDVYTRRVYEIPACRTLLFAQKTNELSKILKENQDAIYWKNDYDFVNKIKFLLKNEKKIKQITKSGYLKITRNKNSELDRVKEVLFY